MDFFVRCPTSLCNQPNKKIEYICTIITFLGGIITEQEKLSRPGGRKREITRVSIVDQICSSIRQDIADGIWKAGDKLPSEAEFAETFAV